MLSQIAWSPRLTPTIKPNRISAFSIQCKQNSTNTSEHKPKKGRGSSWEEGARESYQVLRVFFLLASLLLFTHQQEIELSKLRGQEDYAYSQADTYKNVPRVHTPDALLLPRWIFRRAFPLLWAIVDRQSSSIGYHGGISGQGTWLRGAIMGSRTQSRTVSCTDASQLPFPPVSSALMLIVDMCNVHAGRAVPTSLHVPCTRVYDMACFKSRP